MVSDKSVYSRIKALLAEKRRTNLWLAEQMKVNKTTVSKWCTNDVQPTIENLFKIAETLNIDVRDLLVSNK